MYLFHIFLISSYFRMYNVTPDDFARLESWYPGRFEIEYDRDEADYVYESEKLATLSGKKMHGKKNHVNRFQKEFEGRWSYESMKKRIWRNVSRWL